MLNISWNLPKLSEKNKCYLMTFNLVLSAAPFTSHTQCFTFQAYNLFFCLFLTVSVGQSSCPGCRKWLKWVSKTSCAVRACGSTVTQDKKTPLKHTQAHKIIVVDNFSIHFRWIHLCPEVSVWLRINNSCCLL